MADKFFIMIIVAVLPLYMRCSGRHYQSGSTELKQTCLSELGAGAKTKVSPGDTYVLCWKKVDFVQKTPEPSVEYIVVRRSTGKVIYRGKILSGDIAWYSDEEVLITEKLGILGQRKQNVRSYRINVRTSRITETEGAEKL